MVLMLFDFCMVLTGKRTVSRISYCFVTTFYVSFVLSSIVITSIGERELVNVLTVCLYVNVLLFHNLLIFFLMVEQGSDL